MSVLEKEIWQGQAVVGSADSHKLLLHKAEPFLCWDHNMTNTAHIAETQTSQKFWFHVTSMIAFTLTKVFFRRPAFETVSHTPRTFICLEFIKLLLEKYFIWISLFTCVSKIGRLEITSSYKFTFQKFSITNHHSDIGTLSWTLTTLNCRVEGTPDPHLVALYHVCS